MHTVDYPKIKNMSPQLIVANLESSIEFYTKQLGFSIDFRYEDFYAGVIKDGYSIHLKSGVPFAEERKNKRQNEDLDISFSISGIETFYQEFLAKQVEVVQPLRQMPYGKEFYIADPDGYILCYVETA